MKEPGVCDILDPSWLFHHTIFIYSIRFHFTIRAQVRARPCKPIEVSGSIGPNSAGVSAKKCPTNQFNLSTARIIRKFIMAKQGSFVKAVTQATAKSERLSSAGISAKRSNCQFSSLRSCRRKLGEIIQNIKCFNRWFEQAGVSKLICSPIRSTHLPSRRNLNFHRYITIYGNRTTFGPIRSFYSDYPKYRHLYPLHVHKQHPTQQIKQKMESGVNDSRRTTVLLWLIKDTQANTSNTKAW
jgi:hypothetical protein